MIDARMQAALARLTDNEKECLRRRLQQQTAKEMALELGVSPHAVEKRLKMARAKLGLSSSLEAARLLAASEGYQRTGPQASDLEFPGPRVDNRLNRTLTLGVIAMSLLAATAIIFAVQGGVAPYPSGGVAPMPGSGGPTPGGVPPRSSKVAVTIPPGEFVEATPAEIRIAVRDTFTGFDKDRSGYLEPDEAPIASRFGSNEVAREGTVEQRIYRQDADGRPTGEPLRTFTISLEQARAEYIAQGDANEDGKVDFWEFERWQGPIMAQRGVPKWWKEEINRPIAE